MSRWAALLTFAVLLLCGCAGSTASNHAASNVWRVQTSGTQQRLYDVACLSPVRCEAVGEEGTILSTTDGGTTWRAQVNPLHDSSNALYRIACVAPSSCYIIARPNTILVTHDAGTTWSSDVLGVGASDSNLTDDACLPLYTPISGRPSLCRLGLLDIACASARVCYAVATAPPAYDVQPIPKTAHAVPSSIWMTVDGGTNWTQQPVPEAVACDGDCAAGLYGYPLVWVSCLSSGQCRSGGGHVLGCGHCGFAYAVLVSRGPGMPWACAHAAATCSGLSPDAGDCPGITSCFGIQSTNPFGADVWVVRSTNGGADWVQIGQGWTTSVLNDITCSAEESCYLAGSRGTIGRIANGSTVTAERSPTTSDLYGIGCVGPATCFAVGDKGTILASR
jgi:photosystem II stability/assembly factor-like uncharacterized protein